MFSRFCNVCLFPQLAGYGDWFSFSWLAEGNNPLLLGFFKAEFIMAFQSPENVLLFKLSYILKALFALEFLLSLVFCFCSWNYKCSQSSERHPKCSSPWLQECSSMHTVAMAVYHPSTTGKRVGKVFFFQ